MKFRSVLTPTIWFIASILLTGAFFEFFVLIPESQSELPQRRDLHVLFFLHSLIGLIGAVTGYWVGGIWWVRTDAPPRKALVIFCSALVAFIVLDSHIGAICP